MKIINIGLCLVLCVFMGCATYAPPAHLAPASLATIRGVDSYVWVSHVDNKSVETFFGGLGRGFLSGSPVSTKQWEVQLTPGNHRIRVTYMEGHAGATPSHELPVNVRAGVVYLLKYRVKGSAVQFWIETSDN
jgi:hypothetical protein